MPKITFIGAGLTVFTRDLVGDIRSLPELRDTTDFALMDIDRDRLRTSEAMATNLIDAQGAKARGSATLARREAVDGADSPYDDTMVHQILTELR
jgi:alpha-galactosidase